MGTRKSTTSASQAGEEQYGAGSGRFAYEGLERVIHERARLGIMSSLASHPEGLLFNDLKDLCSLTDGNLSRHLALLQESKLVEVWKGYKNNRPQTLVRLTEEGKRRFLEYVGELENVVADALSAAKAMGASSAAGRAAPARLPLSGRISPA
jgi:DNA-binding MarR family transcriptional regulator